MLSLPSRFDQFRFMIPKDFIPEEVRRKYDVIIAKNANVFANSMDYLNESIRGVQLPGIEEIIQEQPQVSHNAMKPEGRIKGKINIEPHHNNVTLNSGNILSKITNTFTVTFRQNQGLYNYFMLYESIFHRFCKPELYQQYESTTFDIVFLDENSLAVSRMILFQPEFNGISGLDFSYDKVERQSDTFEVQFTFNNIDFDLMPQNITDNSMQSPKPSVSNYHYTKLVQ